jgi:hypothetical protein
MAAGEAAAPCLEILRAALRRADYAAATGCITTPSTPAAARSPATRRPQHRWLRDAARTPTARRPRHPLQIAAFQSLHGRDATRATPAVPFAPPRLKSEPHRPGIGEAPVLLRGRRSSSLNRSQRTGGDRAADGILRPNLWGRRRLLPDSLQFLAIRCNFFHVRAVAMKGSCYRILYFFSDV